jgi:hypothetical protein
VTAYSTLIAAKGTAGSIKDWVNNSTIPSEQILTEAQSAIYARLRVREMHAIGTATMGTGTEVMALASDLRAFRGGRMWITGTAKAAVVLRREDEVEAARSYGSSGTLETFRPEIFAIVGTEAHFPSLPDAEHVVRYPYYRTPAALGTATETNFLTEKYPTILRAMCLSYANDYLKDDAERDRWLKMAMALIMEANAESDMAFGGLEMELTNS